MKVDIRESRLCVVEQVVRLKAELSGSEFFSGGPDQIVDLGIITKERTGGGLNKRAIFAPLFSTLSVFPN